MRIWKWTLKVNNQQKISMPAGAKPLSVQIQHGGLQLWALCDENAQRVERTIAIYETGESIPDEPGEFIGTFQAGGGGLVFHVFDLGDGTN